MGIDNNIKNPCIHVCTKEEKGICLGCYRSMEEIRDWYKYSDKQKLKVLDNALSRRTEYDKELPYI